MVDYRRPPPHLHQMVQSPRRPCTGSISQHSDNVRDRTSHMDRAVVCDHVAALKSACFIFFGGSVWLSERAAPILTDSLEAFNEGMGYNSIQGPHLRPFLVKRTSWSGTIWLLILLSKLGGSHAFERAGDVQGGSHWLPPQSYYRWQPNLVPAVCGGDVAQVAFFRLRVRLWETNEQCLERLMLAIKPIIVKCHKGFGHCSFWRVSFKELGDDFCFSDPLRKLQHGPWNIPKPLPACLWMESLSYLDFWGTWSMFLSGSVGSFLDRSEFRISWESNGTSPPPRPSLFEEIRPYQRIIILQPLVSLHFGRYGVAIA